VSSFAAHKTNPLRTHRTQLSALTHFLHTYTRIFAHSPCRHAMYCHALPCLTAPQGLGPGLGLGLDEEVRSRVKVVHPHKQSAGEIDGFDTVTLEASVRHFGNRLNNTRLRARPSGTHSTCFVHWCTMLSVATPFKTSATHECKQFAC
jgi:hypothetical protein